ncbi:F-box/FBD/LRR-repeat protein At1g51370-like [Zingiber officinale]|uniref:F-box/FBD/LRR-repeat protein At1g51370-like n=1 Tax=Zingiber officinale TaxID=94328 RepID=UPI001C4D9AD2|nr:F-box/FBD/LRR-repeat protein At1g51370-like [Zingiber officinale]
MDEFASSPRRVRRRVLSDEEDYLSGLPDELLHHILSFLPTRDSIRTSLLARRWRRVWASVPAIDFSYTNEIINPDTVGRFLSARSDSHSVSRLRLPGLGLQRIQSPICNLLDYAKSHGTQDATLHCHSLDPSLLDDLLHWPSLASLNLKALGCQNCTLAFNSIALSNLRTLFLRLGEAAIPNETLTKLLSGCPLLEELKLSAEYPQHETIQIEAPNLL